jgi:hypothetical protein
MEEYDPWWFEDAPGSAIDLNEVRGFYSNKMEGCSYSFLHYFN